MTRVAFVGLGAMGLPMATNLLARGFAVAGYDLNAKALEALEQAGGARAATAAEAARGGEIVIVTIPQRAVPDLPKDLFAGVPGDVAVVDTGNYYPTRDGRIDAIEDGQVESAWVAEHLGRPVVKAFNNIAFQSLLENGRPEGAPGRIALPVAGDPPGARRKVMRLVDELGFDPVDAGGLEDSWRQQPGTPGYAADLDAPRLKEALAAADRGRLPEYRRQADDDARAFFASR